MPLSHARFSNALTVKRLQNQRESRICGRNFWRGFHLLINKQIVQKNKISIDKNNEKNREEYKKIGVIALPFNASEPYFRILKP